MLLNTGCIAMGHVTYSLYQFISTVLHVLTQHLPGFGGRGRGEGMKEWGEEYQERGRERGR